MKKAIVPNDRERPFLIHELFFSTTDHKGIIESGNDVFVRVSGHPIEEIIGSPHNIIRHPDMPRAVFKLLWDYLKSGKTFAGFVKNMAADGAYYWVMALVVPYKKGYISVRFKPSGPYFAAAREIYAEMLGIEKGGGNNNVEAAPATATAGVAAGGAKPGDWRDRMELAAGHMMSVLREKGFDSYDVFMQTAIASEMTLRRDALAKGEQQRRGSHALAPASSKYKEKIRKTSEICAGIDRQLDGLFSHVASFLDLIEKLNQRSLSLNTLSKDIKTVSLNGVIASNRLGEIGRGLSVVTQALTTVSGESTDSISKISTELGTMSSLMHRMAFAITAAKLQVEMTLFFAREILEADTAPDAIIGSLNPATDVAARVHHDIETLVETLGRSVVQILETLPESSVSTTHLIRLKDRLNDSLRQLSRIRVTGKVQASYIPEAGYFQNLFDNVYGQLENAAAEMQELSDAIFILKKQLPTMTHTSTSVQNALGGLA